MLAHRLPQPGNGIQQARQTQRLRLVVNLQGADAWRQVDNPIQRPRLQSLHQGVGAKTQDQIQLRIANLQQQVCIAGEPRHQPFISLPLLQHHRRGGFGRLPCYVQRVQAGDLCRLRLGKLPGGGDIHGNKAHLIPRFQLPHRVQIGLDDGDRADKPAQAWAIRAEDHRHIPGKVHRADSIGIVVDVRRMQSRFAAALAHPLRLRPDQAHPGAAGVEVHFPVGGEEGGHVSRGEILRRAVRAVDHPQRTHRLKRGAERRGKRLRRAWGG